MTAQTFRVLEEIIGCIASGALFYALVVVLGLKTFRHKRLLIVLASGVPVTMVLIAQGIVLHAPIGPLSGITLIWLASVAYVSLTIDREPHKPTDEYPQQ